MSGARHPYYLAGRPLLGSETLDVTDKYSGEVIAKVAVADASAIDSAFEAASAARPKLRAFPPFARKAVLVHTASRLKARSDELAHLLAVEAGKPLRDGRGEVSRLVETFEVAAEEAVRVDGEAPNLEISPRGAGSRAVTQLVPVGICSFLTPFNFPLNLVAHKVAPAIAAGCPFVLKPSERTPLSALVIGEVLAETDLPPGSFSILPVPVERARSFVEDPRIALLSFTGSEKVGWDVKARAGRAKVVLELGGNAACIVDEDQGEELDRVVARLAFGGFYQSGQSCVSVQRILAHRSIASALVERLVTAARALVPGDPKDEQTSLGPLIDEAAAKRVVERIESASRRGARVLTGGGRTGSVVEATVLTQVPPDEPVSSEEIFGPVVVVSEWERIDEAFAAVNASRFGLQAGIFTHDLRHATKAWDELEVGAVIVGDVPSFRMDNMPYGGVKASGLGREGVRHAIREMSETRLLVLRS